MAVELHASVKSFLVSTGMVTQADADAKGTDVLADLPIMDAVAVYGMIEAAKKRADLEVQKEALMVTAGQMQLNNESIENWRERAAIAASRTWPTDQATIDELIRELDKDTAPPALPPDPPTTQGEAADKADKDIDKDIDDSRTQNKKIRAFSTELPRALRKPSFRKTGSWRSHSAPGWKGTVSKLRSRTTWSVSTGRTTSRSPSSRACSRASTCL